MLCGNGKIRTNTTMKYARCFHRASAVPEETKIIAKRQNFRKKKEKSIVIYSDNMILLFTNMGDNI